MLKIIERVTSRCRVLEEPTCGAWTISIFQHDRAVMVHYCLPDNWKIYTGKALFETAEQAKDWAFKTEADRLAAVVLEHREKLVELPGGVELLWCAVRPKKNRAKW